MFRYIIIIIPCFFLSALCGWVNAQDICGIWLTANSEAKIEIKKKGNEHYEGKLIWTMDKSEKSKKTIGAVIVKDFVKTGKNNYKGIVNDLDKNKTYYSTITLISDNVMELRGYIGIPLFGRTEKWTRCN
jgi:uncharacterized protein (DUF2147 family)